VSSFNFGSLFAEVSFEQMLPADFVLGVDEHAEHIFAVVGIHLEVLVEESTSNSLDQHESKAGMRVIAGQCATQGTKKLFTPQWTFGTAENMPVGLDNVVAGGAFVGVNPFDSMHVSASRQMVVRKFDDHEDLGTVL
jgi:hypothetical protein